MPPSCCMFMSLPWLQCGQGINYRRVCLLWIGDSSEPAYRAFLTENDAPKQVLSMWGSPPTAGYLLVRCGATDRRLEKMHVELRRRSFELSATMLSGSKFWQDSFYCNQQVVASQISMHCRAILLNVNMMQCTQELVLVGRNGVSDPVAIIWDGRFHSSSMVYLQSEGMKRRLRGKTDLRTFFFEEVHMH